MLSKERKFYTDELLESIQVDFDYSTLVNDVTQDIYAIYGDRGMPEYPAKIQDLNLFKNETFKTMYYCPCFWSFVLEQGQILHFL